MTEPLILVPGLLCDAELYAAQTLALADTTRCLIADTRHDESLGNMAERLLADAPDRFALAGLSMGGYVSLEVIRRAPERVTRLALIDTRARADTAEETNRRRRLMKLASKGSFKEVTGLVLPSFIHPERLADKPLVKQIEAMATRIGPEVFIRQQQAILSRRDMIDSLPAISCPTVIICGEQDALTPLPESRLMADRIAGSELVVIPQCGHLSTMERPDAVSEALESWLHR